MTPSRLLLLSFALFSIGVFGVLARRHVIAILLSIELMFNGANLAVVSLAWAHGWASGIVIVLFAMAVTVAEVALGLALFLLADRVRKATSMDDLSELKG